jgi:HAD superfamily hydrolase (TIGR01490 family)
MTTDRAAFFDCDKTLIPGSSLFLLARGLYDRDFVRARDLAKWAWTQFAYRAIGTERMQSMPDIQQSALEFVKGKHVEELRALGREIAEERILPRVYADIANVIAQHRAHGDDTWLMTAAPQEVADAIAKGLGMTGAIGTVSELDRDGYFTGRLAGPLMHGPEKAKAAEQLASEHGYHLPSCAAYSDSKNDLPLLEAVGAAHAVNPDAELKRIARARGWPLHELRTRRRALLIGVPSTVGAATLFGTGVALGWRLARRLPRD